MDSSTTARDRSRSPHQHSPDSPIRRRRSRPHRRAATACQVCRLRKTKCDNTRPTCSFCAVQGLTCLYQEDNASQPRPEPSNSVLLERLNHVVSLLAQGTPSAPTTPARAHVPEKQVVHRSNFTGDGFGQLEIPEIAARTISCESILRWPIFQQEVSDPPITSLLLQSELDDATSSPGWAADLGDANSLQSSLRRTRTVPAKPTLAEDNIVPLCKKFQALLFPKNPFMTANDFARYVRDVSENGPGWDGPSCLVLLACALASLVTPFETPAESNGLLIEQETPLAYYTDEDAANSFFIAAKKRLGLLSISLIAVQCYYFAGLFEKFAFRPLSAWELFHQGVIKFQTGILKRAGAQASHDADILSGARHFEQRLYWSCVKAECELRAELQFPPTGLANFKYPEAFPALSMPTAEDGSNAGAVIGLSASEEHSWLYYLAEISMRGIMNRILDDIYSDGNEKWISSIHILFQYVETCRDELQTWRSHLPPPLRFDDQGTPPNEYAFFLQSRYFTCLEWVHRPFLFYIISNPTGASYYYSRAMHLAEDCAKHAALLVQAVAHPHRFGGVWFNMRRAFSGAVLLLAARRDGKVTLSADWIHTVELAIHELGRWENGAPDLRRCRFILCHLLERSTASSPN